MRASALPRGCKGIRKPEGVRTWRCILFFGGETIFLNLKCRLPTKHNPSFVALLTHPTPLWPNWLSVFVRQAATVCLGLVAARGGLCLCTSQIFRRFPISRKNDHPSGAVDRSFRQQSPVVGGVVMWQRPVFVMTQIQTAERGRKRVAVLERCLTRQALIAY